MTKTMWIARKFGSRSRALIGAALVVVIPACKGYPLCDSELKDNTSYIATISQTYNQQSTALYDSRYAVALTEPLPSCGGWDGLGFGATISVATTKRLPIATCDLLYGRVTSLPSGAMWQEDPSGLGNLAGGFKSPSSIFTAEGEIISGPCLGYFKVAMERPVPETSVFSQTIPGFLPSMVLGRIYAPFDNDAGPSCQPCADSYVAQLAVVK